jgi:hypothetical protein
VLIQMNATLGKQFNCKCNQRDVRNTPVVYVSLLRNIQDTTMCDVLLRASTFRHKGSQSRKSVAGVVYGLWLHSKSLAGVVYGRAGVVYGLWLGRKSLAGVVYGLSGVICGLWMGRKSLAGVVYGVAGVVYGLPPIFLCPAVIHILRLPSFFCPAMVHIIRLPICFCSVLPCAGMCPC